MIYQKNDGKIFTKKNSRAIYNDFNIVGDNFYFDRNLNILNADGSVVFENKNENYKIYSDEMIYQKNDEKIFTKKNSRAIYNDFNIVGDNFYFDRNLNILNADGNVKIDDKIENYTIKAEEITYKKLDEFISKGKTSAVLEDKYEIQSSDVILNRKSKNSYQKPSIIKDDKYNLYKLNNFIFL